MDNVKPGTTLVLYNFAARTLTGPYEALESPKWTDVPDAWQGGRGAPPGRRLISAFPVQVPIGASPLMEAVTATLGGDFRPSVGGLPLGSPARDSAQQERHERETFLLVPPHFLYVVHKLKHVARVTPRILGASRVALAPGEGEHVHRLVRA